MVVIMHLGLISLWQILLLNKMVGQEILVFMHWVIDNTHIMHSNLGDHTKYMSYKLLGYGQFLLVSLSFLWVIVNEFTVEFEEKGNGKRVEDFKT